jgi:hypothetical protein
MPQIRGAVAVTSKLSAPYRAHSTGILDNSATTTNYNSSSLLNWNALFSRLMNLDLPNFWEMRIWNNLEYLAHVWLHFWGNFQGTLRNGRIFILTILEIIQLQQHSRGQELMELRVCLCTWTKQYKSILTFGPKSRMARYRKKCCYFALMSYVTILFTE